VPKWSGRFCSYLVSSFGPGTSTKTQELHLEGGEAVSWVVQVYHASSSSLRPPPILTWQLKNGSNLKSLSVDAYHLGFFQQDYDIFNVEETFSAKELCWTEVRSTIT
jgi:hypothetical protein